MEEDNEYRIIEEPVVKRRMCVKGHGVKIGKTKEGKVYMRFGDGISYTFSAEDAKVLSKALVEKAEEIAGESR